MAWVAGVRQAGHSGWLRPHMRTAQSMQKRLWPQGTSAAMASPSAHTTHSRARAAVGGPEAAGAEEAAGAQAAADTEGLRLLSEALESSAVGVEKLVPLEKGGRVPCGGRQGSGPTGSGAPLRASGSSRPRAPLGLGSGSVGEWRGVAVPLLLRAPAGGGPGVPLMAVQLLKVGKGGAARSNGAQIVAAVGTERSRARKSKPKSQSSGAGVPALSPPKVKPPLPELL